LGPATGNTALLISVEFKATRRPSRGRDRWHTPPSHRTFGGWETSGATSPADRVVSDPLPYVREQSRTSVLR